MRRFRLLQEGHLVLYSRLIECIDDTVRKAAHAVYAQGLTSKDKDIIFTSGTRNIEGKTNIAGVVHVLDLIESG